MQIVWRRPMATITLEAWIDDRQAHGGYTFLRSDAVADSGLSAEAVKKALQRRASRCNAFFTASADRPLSATASERRKVYPPCAWRSSIHASKVMVAIGRLQTICIKG